MDSFELNKIAGAVLTAGLVAMVAGAAAEILVHPHELEENVYQVAVLEPADDAGMAEAPAEPPIANLLQQASVEGGEKVAKKCAACHTFEEGGAAKVGPPLWDVVNRTPATVSGFSYSDALQGLADQPWDFHNLNAYLTNPKAYAPGTKMAFAGLGKASDRANLLAYMRTLSASPAALPEPEPEPEPAAQEAEPGEAAAESGTPEGEAAGMGEDAAEDVVSKAVETVADTAADTADVVSKAGEEVAETAGSTAKDAADVVESAAKGVAGAAGEAAKAVESAASEAADAAGKMAEDAAAKVEEAASSVTAALDDSTGEAEQAAAGGGFSAMVAAADPAAGEKVAKKCAACHTTDKGGKNKIGPNLWNIVNATPANVSDFKYSDAMMALQDKPWTYDNLNAYLTKPKDYAPGTRMAFPGVRKDEDRANLIAYLRTLSDEPAPLP